VTRLEEVQRDGGCPTLGLQGWVLGFPMPTGLQRYYGKGHFHFVTFSCYQRLPLLEAEKNMTLFLTELARVRAAYHFRLVGYVLMPNHVHLL